MNKVSKVTILNGLVATRPDPTVGTDLMWTNGEGKKYFLSSPEQP